MIREGSILVLISQIIKELKISRYYLFGIFSGVITQLFFAIFKIYTLTAFVGGNESISPMNISQTVLYVWVTQILFAIVPWNVNGKDFDSVRTGAIATELIKPVDLFKLIYAKTISWRMVGFLTRAIPLFIIASVGFSLLGFSDLIIKIPSKDYCFVFLISVSLSLILSTLITVLLYTLAFFFTSIANFIGVISSIAFVLSGMIIPLTFYPEQLSLFLNYQPFKFIVDTPALILNQSYTITESINQLFFQFFWIVILFVANFLAYQRIENRIEINGG